MAKRQPLGVTVKETVDFMYEMLVQHPNGCEFSATSLGATPARVVCILVQRGIVERKNIYTKNGQKSMYKWAVNQAPTYVLYGSITQELRDKMKDEVQRSEMKKGRKEETAVDPDALITRPVSDEMDIIHEEPLTYDESREQEKPVRISEGVDLENPIRVEKPTKETVHTEDVTLSIFGIDELVAELRRRECFIENNKIVLVKRVEYAL